MAEARATSMWLALQSHWAPDLVIRHVTWTFGFVFRSIRRPELDRGLVLRDATDDMAFLGDDQV